MKAIFLLAVVLTGAFMTIVPHAFAGHICLGSGICAQCFDQSGHPIGGPGMIQNFSWYNDPNTVCKPLGILYQHDNNAFGALVLIGAYCNTTNDCYNKGVHDGFQSFLPDCHPALASHNITNITLIASYCSGFLAGNNLRD